MNRSRRVANFHPPAALTEMMARDFDGPLAKLRALPNDNPRLRPDQRAANAAVEQAIADRKREMMIAQATGCGKTFQTVNQVYRLMKADVAKRVLFLVDRRALAAQAVRAFRSFEPEPGLKFDQTYELYSQRFQQADFGEDEKFDPTILPQNYVTDPQPSHAFVYVCTIQRMAMNLLGRAAAGVFGGEAEDEDADKLDIPIHTFDLIVADECHRGYSAGEVSTWRDTLNHFDAIKLGLTATPASHTVAFFKEIVYRYSYEERVDRALGMLTAGKIFTTAQQKWLGRIRQHLFVNLTIEQGDFDNLPVFADFGGWQRASTDFGGNLPPLIADINAAMAA